MLQEVLKQYKDICKEIKELEKRIKNLENKIETDKVKGSNAEFPYQARSFTIEGLASTSELIDLLGRRKSRCEKLKVRIEEFISDIPDSRTRRVFQYRYMDNLSWQTIAIRLGKVHESYPRRDIHDKYLEGLE